MLFGVKKVSEWCRVENKEVNEGDRSCEVKECLGKNYPDTS